MLYHVHMQVETLHLLPAPEAEALKVREKAYAQDLQRQGKWLHLWRIAGEYANVSIFDVASHDELHTLLAALPLFPYMKLKVTPLAHHPSALR
jgi:muconolactone D-isomerase